MKRLIFGVIFVACRLLADTPSISNISVTPDTNAVTVAYDVAPQAAYTATAATSSGGSTTYTLGANAIQPYDYVVVSGCSNSDYNTSAFGPGYEVTSGTSSTVTVPQAVGTAFSGTCTVTVWPYCWVQYGIASGQYLWSSASYNAAEFSTAYALRCTVPIGGLADGLNYYFLPTARPHADDETDACVSSGCGATETAQATPSASAPHLPAAAASVAPIMLAEPDTSGYAVVTLAATGTNGECVSTGNVNPPSGYTVGVSWNGFAVQAIAATNSLSTILDPTQGKLWFGTVFEVPAGVTCIVPNIGGAISGPAGDGAGYFLPALAVDPSATGGSIDAANHRFIIFRSGGASSNFPPYGARTAPTFWNAYGGFQQNTPVATQGYNLGAIFDMSASQNHHIWIENLKFTVDETQTTKNFEYFITLAMHGGSATPYPKYININRCYFHGPARTNIQTGTPSVAGVIVGAVGGNYVVSGNYADNIYYAAGTSPGGQGIVQGVETTNGTGGPGLIDNNYIMGMPMSIYLEQVVSGAEPSFDWTLSRNALYWPAPTLSYARAIGNFGCRNQIETKGTHRISIVGNYVNGQWACANTGGAILVSAWSHDVTIQSNLVRKVVTFASLSNVVPHGYGGVGGAANRFLVTNNLVYDVDRLAYQAGGGGIATSAFEIAGAITNLAILRNTIGPIDGGDYYFPITLNLGGAGTGAMAGLQMVNNVLPLGFAASQGSGGGIWAAPSNLDAPSVFSHPSTPLILLGSLDATATLNSTAGVTDGAAGLGMQGLSVIHPGSGYTPGGSITASNCTGTVGTYNEYGGAIIGSDVTGTAGAFTSFGDCNPSTFAIAPASGTGGSGASLRPHYGLTAAYSWLGNSQICTYFGGVTLVSSADMTAAQCSRTGGSTLTSTMPTGDIYASGSSIAARLVNAGLAGHAVDDYRCTPTAESGCGSGANINQLESDLGIVSQISTQVAATSASVSYLAPDARACSVDISADSGAHWTRQTDTGGARLRSVVFTGLRAAHSYVGRVVCYFDQSEGVTAGWFSFPSDPSNIATSLAFTTLASATATPSFPFSLAAVTGATSFKVQLTAIDGTVTSKTCSSSPCTLTSPIPTGSYSVVQQWLNGSAVLASGDTQTISVQ